MKFDIITIFPKAFDSYFSQSIIGRAAKRKLISIKIHNLRDFTNDKRKTVDDKPYGGGAGMVLMIEPILKAVKKILRTKAKRKIILLSAKGKTFDQKKARQLSKLDQIVLISGHYEGIDERVAKYLADEEISVGDYVLTGGEIPAMIIVDAVTRLIPGVIRKESLNEESFAKENVKEYPQYTRPAVFKGFKNKLWKVPKVLLSGNHADIKAWREKNR